MLLGQATEKNFQLIKQKVNYNNPHVINLLLQDFKFLSKDTSDWKKVSNCFAIL